MKALNRLSNLDVSFVSLVNRAAVRDPSNPTEPMRFLLTKSEIPIVDMTAGGAIQTEGGHMPETEAELRAALEKAETDNAALREQIEKMGVPSAKKPKAGKKPQPTDANPDPDHDGDDDRTPAGDTDNDYHPGPKGGDNKMTKSEREEIAKAAEERIQKAEKRAEEAEKIAKEERDQRIRGEFIQKAETEFSLLGDPQEIGPRLQRKSELMSPEDFEAELTQMRAVQAQLEKADRLLLGQFGVDGSPTAGGDNVEKAQAKAVELRKADPNLSEIDAMRQVIRENPDLILANR